MNSLSPPRFLKHGGLKKTHHSAFGTHPRGPRIVAIKWIERNIPQDKK
jgi:hypothetical protein